MRPTARSVNDILKDKSPRTQTLRYSAQHNSIKFCGSLLFPTLLYLCYLPKLRFNPVQPNHNGETQILSSKLPSKTLSERWGQSPAAGNLPPAHSTMAEVQVQAQSGQPSSSSQSQTQRGSRQRRGPRRGRGRGGQTAVAGADAGQGNHQNPRNNAPAHVTSYNNASTTNNNRSPNNNNNNNSPHTNLQDGNGRQNATPSVSSRGASRGGRGARGGRGGRGGQAQSQRGGGGKGGRGGSTMPSRRVFGGNLTESQDGQAPGSAGLSGDAPEFVPGHAPPQGR